jgi:hypothetical protein
MVTRGSAGTRLLVQCDPSRDIGGIRGARIGANTRHLLRRWRQSSCVYYDHADSEDLASLWISAILWLVH